jgi:hypothetical protein
LNISIFPDSFATTLLCGEVGFSFRKGGDVFVVFALKHAHARCLVVVGWVFALMCVSGSGASCGAICDRKRLWWLVVGFLLVKVHCGTSSG